MLDQKLFKDARSVILIEKHAQATLEKLAQGWGAQAGETLIDKPMNRLGQQAQNMGQNIRQSLSNYGFGAAEKQQGPGPGTWFGNLGQQIAQAPGQIANLGRTFARPFQNILAPWMRQPQGGATAGSAVRGEAQYPTRGEAQYPMRQEPPGVAKGMGATPGEARGISGQRGEPQEAPGIKKDFAQFHGGAR